MCGIAGIVAPDVAIHRQALERMVDALRHRGPDDRGIHLFDSCALGHTRLSVIDPAGGRQPMLADGGKLAVTFNGEIYGYQEIRHELRDYPFRTACDTELILALYERYGETFLSRLPGMFAFALWDEPRQALVCARDRFGEKPFYYARGKGGSLLFASELKAILASGLVEPVISRRSLVHYLRHLYVHPRTTIYENVRTLPPAHLLVYNGGRIRSQRYWELPLTDETLELDEAVERFRHLLERAVRRQLVADVPVGAFLSGGLDSSTIVAAASSGSSRLRTFSFGFGAEGNDERPYARAVASHHGTEHVEMQTPPTDLAELLRKMAEVYDEPFADSSNIPTYLICQAARRGLKVVLTGDGGDELLAGYDFWYAPLLEMERTPGPSRWPLWPKRAIRAALRRLGRARWAEILPPGRGAELRQRYGTLARAHAGLQSCFDDHALDRLGLRRERLDAAVDGGGYDTLDAALRHDLCTYMPGDILTKIDRAAMAHGLELRAPFLDVDFASFCISLPLRLKIRPGRDKLILREAFADEWPPRLGERGKQGFAAPVGAWLRRPAIAALIEQYLGRDRRIYELISYPAARSMMRRNEHRTWSLLVLSLWMESHPFPLGR